MSQDPFELERFVTAQDAGGVYPQALAELRAGSKRGHWMWFVFPQLRGLGGSEMSRRYALASVAEAAAYLEHPVLGPRLLECVRALLALPAGDATAVLGGIDALKLRSSVTLFARAAAPGAAEPFQSVLTKYFDGRADPATEALLSPAD